MQLLRPSKRSFKLFLVPTKQTEAVDDYLKAILELSGPQETRVSSNALAARLGVSTPTVISLKKRMWFALECDPAVCPRTTASSNATTP